MPDDLAQMPETMNPPSRIEPKTKRGIDASKSHVDRLAQSQSVLLSWTIDISETMQAFSRARLSANVDAWRSLMSCQHPVELAGLHREYVETTTAQYSKYAHDMSEKIRQCARDLTPCSDDA